MIVYLQLISFSLALLGVKVGPEGHPTLPQDDHKHVLSDQQVGLFLAGLMIVQSPLILIGDILDLFRRHHRY